MVFVKKSTFFSFVFFFWAKKARKKDFLIFRIEKNAFQTTKDKFYKTLKNRHFAKGLVHGFCVKIDLFLIRLFLSKKGRKKNFLIFWMENKAFWTLKVKFSQSRKKSTFCKGVSPWLLSKNQPFPGIFFFLSQKSLKNQFFYFLESKQCFSHLKS